MSDSTVFWTNGWIYAATRLSLLWPRVVTPAHKGRETTRLQVKEHVLFYFLALGIHALLAMQVMAQSNLQCCV